MVNLGNRLTTGYWCRIEAITTNISTPPHLLNCVKIYFGDNVQINDYVHISALNKVKIGNNVLIASHVYISDNSHGIYDDSELCSNPNIPPTSRPYLVEEVEIGDNTWIGEGVIIMPGCKIGKGCVIGAHSVVNKAIPDYSIAVGSPAKVIKKYDTHKNIWIKI